MCCVAGVAEVDRWKREGEEGRAVVSRLEFTFLVPLLDVLGLARDVALAAVGLGM